MIKDNAASSMPKYVTIMSYVVLGASALFGLVTNGFVGLIAGGLIGLVLMFCVALFFGSFKTIFSKK